MKVMTWQEKTCFFKWQFAHMTEVERLIIIAEDPDR
jgi:hypothetical protein